MNVQNNYKFNIIKALEGEKGFEKKRKCERTLLLLVVCVEFGTPK